MKCFNKCNDSDEAAVQVGNLGSQFISHKCHS